MSSINETADRPLVTFALFAYNQEKYIREAVEGAFAQTYEPLEIILSDDGSSDRTFEIMSQMTKNYKGPHTIILNRNPVNKGFISHINKVCFELFHGEFIVMAAGDDISTSERVVEIWNSFNKDPDVTSVSTDYIYIDKDGLKTGCSPSSKENLFILSDYLSGKQLPLKGCTRAYSRKSIEEFGPLREWCGVEDSTLVFRSLLLGSLSHINVPVVKYRIHSGSMSKKIMLSMLRGVYRQRIGDINKALLSGHISCSDSLKIKDNLRLGLRKNIIKSRYVSSRIGLYHFLSNTLFNLNLKYFEKKEIFKIILKNIFKRGVTQ